MTRILERVVQKLSVTPSHKQIDAVKETFRHNLSIITGSPGTGKTTVLRIILEIYRFVVPNGKIMLAAPTGRASRRMADATGFTDAKTLHMALGLVSDDKDECGPNKNPIDANLIIVDEASMVDMRLAAELFSCIRRGTKILLVGDADQLPSVGAGNVFRELIASHIIPVKQYLGSRRTA